MTHKKEAAFAQMSAQSRFFQTLAPDGSRDVSQNAASVAFAVDIARTVRHFFERINGFDNIGVAGVAFFVHKGNNGAGVPLFN